MRKIELTDEDFDKIMTYVTKEIYLEDMGRVIVPFMYILAASYLYPENQRQAIIDFSSQFNINIIKDLIEDVKKGKDSRRIGFF